MRHYPSCNGYGQGLMPTPRRRRYATARGQSLAEFALTIPIFLALLFGTLEAGMALKTQAAYQEAVQEAVRVAAAAGTAGDADTQALAQLHRMLSAEDARRVIQVIIYKANVDGSYASKLNADGSYNTTTPCDVTACGGFDNQHTYYVYSASLNRFVCQNSGQDPPCGTCPTGSLAGCVRESYWDPLRRSTVVGNLDHIGITVKYDYKGVTKFFLPLHMSQTFVTTIEPQTYPT